MRVKMEFYFSFGKKKKGNPSYKLNIGYTFGNILPHILLLSPNPTCQLPRIYQPILCQRKKKLTPKFVYYLYEVNYTG